MWYMLITWFCWNPVFHFLVLCCSQSGDRPEKNLANFDYTPYMKQFFLKMVSFHVFGSLLEHIIEIWRFGKNFIKSTKELTELKEVSPFMAWQFKKGQRSSVNLGHLFHKFPHMGWNSIFQVTIGQKFDAGRIPGKTYLLQAIRETKLKGITITTLNIISLQPSSSLANLYLKSLEDLKLD